MSKEIVTLEGICAWAYNLFVPDNNFNDEKWYLEVFFEPNGEEHEKFKESGIQLEPIPEKSKSGKQRSQFPDLVGYRFKRRKFEKWGEMSPPVVRLGDGTPLPEDVRIGNGSKVKITVETYDTAKGKGHRLNEVLVKELVEYDSPKSEPVEEAKKTAVSKTVKKPW